MQKSRHTLLWIFCAAIAGISLGILAPNLALKLMSLSSLVLQLIKAAAVPLVFFAVIDAVINFSVKGKDFTKLIFIVLINSSIAVALGILAANWFKPGDYLSFLSNNKTKLEQFDFLKILHKQIPTSIAQPFVDNNILALVIIALIFGFAWRELFPQQEHNTWLSQVRATCELMLRWVVRLVPLAASAKLSATHGLKLLGGLSYYVGLCIACMLVHVFFVYGAWLLFYVRMSILCFWRFAFAPALYSFSVNSSLVALPLTLGALDQLGVSRRASTLVACVGTNLNNDGISM